MGPINIFLDSSILIEHSKGNKPEMMAELFGRQISLCYNAIVQTEYLYYFLSMHGMKAPRTLKEAKRIPDILTQNDPLSLIGLLKQLSDANSPSTLDVVRLMKTYNMLPNDAIILAHCLSAGIKFLASYDVTDFTIPCREEGIVLLDSVDALGRHFPAS